MRYSFVLTRFVNLEPYPSTNFRDDLKCSNGKQADKGKTGLTKTEASAMTTKNQVTINMKQKINDALTILGYRLAEYFLTTKHFSDPVHSQKVRHSTTKQIKNKKR